MTFQFPHILTNTYYVFLIMNTLVSVKWNLILVLICTPLMANDTEHLFMSLLFIFGEMLIQIPRPFFFIGLSFYTEFFIYSRYISLTRYLICKNFLPFCGWSFQFSDRAL